MHQAAVMARPCVSVGLPVYNGEARIGPALDSVLSQSFTDFELIICDNASTDRTGEICETYARRDRRVTYSRNPTNIGVNPNHDRVFELATGKYFTWFADDVEYLPGMLSRCVTVMEQAPSPVLVYPWCEMVRDGQAMPAGSEHSVACKDPRPYRRLEQVVRHVVMVNQFFGLIHREALAKTQLNGIYASSDYVLLAELAMLGEIREIPQVLVRRRIDSDRGTQAVHSDLKEWKKWLGQGGKAGLRGCLPYRERLAVEYLRAAWRLELKPTDKLRCLTTILVTYYERMSRSARFLIKMTHPWRRKQELALADPIGTSRN